MTQPDHLLDHLSTEDLLEVVQGVHVRDLGLLASAATRPTVFGRQAHPTLAGQAAALVHSLARNCLLNGTDLATDVETPNRWCRRWPPAISTPWNWPQ